MPKILLIVTAILIAGIDCANPKTVAKVGLEAGKKRRQENGTRPASASESGAAK